MIALLPEQTRYQDTGCSVAPSCLACPLPRCRYDVVQGNVRRQATGDQAQRRRERDLAILAGFEAGERPEVTAVRLGISRRTVHRVLSQQAGRSA